MTALQGSGSDGSFLWTLTMKTNPGLDFHQALMMMNHFANLLKTIPVLNACQPSSTFLKPQSFRIKCFITIFQLENKFSHIIKFHCRTGQTFDSIWCLQKTSPWYTQPPLNYSKLSCIAHNIYSLLYHNISIIVMNGLWQADLIVQQSTFYKMVKFEPPILLSC